MPRPKGKELLFYALLLVLYLLNALSGEFVDERDNIVGGKLITKGVLPYTGFASQHFPLPYFISAAMHLVTGTDFILFRLLFALMLFLWSAFLYRCFRKPDNESLIRYFFVLVAWALITKYRGAAIPGWTSTVIPIFLVGGLNMLFMGLIGEYTWARYTGK